MTTTMTISPGVNESRDSFLRRCMADGNGRTECEVAFHPEAVKQATFRELESRRQRHDRQQERNIRDALQKSFAPVIRAVRQAAPAMDMVNEATSDPVFEALANLWTTVSLDFALQEREEMLKQKGIRRWGVLKEVDEELLESFVLENVRDHAQDGWETRAKSITQTGKKQVAEAMQESIDAGEGAEDAAVRMERKVNEVSLRRARVIARTEIVGAQNWGGRQGAVASGVDVVKQWLSARDGRVRTFQEGNFSHMAADGEIQEISKSFVNTGEAIDYPGAIDGSVGNVANCRCAETHIPRDRL